MNLEVRIDAIQDSLHQLKQRLSQFGYQFERPTEALPGPEKETAQAIARIECEIGALPLSLKLFWERIGGVDFCGSHLDWRGCVYPDPIVVYPPSIAIEELDEFLADREERLRYDFPYCVPIAPDVYCKENVSGGMWYNITVPAVADDPLLNDEWHHTTFMDYLEIAIRWGGFLGLESCPDHTWPLAELISNSSGRGP